MGIALRRGCGADSAPTSLIPDQQESESIGFPPAEKETAFPHPTDGCSPESPGAWMTRRKKGGLLAGIRRFQAESKGFGESLLSIVGAEAGLQSPADDQYRTAFSCSD